MSSGINGPVKWHLVNAALGAVNTYIDHQKKAAYDQFPVVDLINHTIDAADNLFTEEKHLGVAIMSELNDNHDDIHGSQ